VQIRTHEDLPDNKTPAKTDEASNELTGNFLERTLSSVLINVLKTEDGRIFFENILKPMNKPLNHNKQSFKVNNTDFINSMFQIKTFGEGEVGPASCGHVVTINYQISDMQGALIDEQTKTYPLGSRPIIAGLDAIVVGMMVGQSRSAVIPPKYGYKDSPNKKASIDPDQPYKINVVLKEILPHNFVRSDEVKVFDDEIAYQQPLMCGDKVVFDAKITKLTNSTVLYDSNEQGKKINMTIGDVYNPLIFSFALHGKIPSGVRTIIAKGRTFKALGSNINKITLKSAMEPEEYFMLELMNFQE